MLVATGSPDIGGSRASMALMAAETLGVDYDQVRAIVADTGSVGYTHVTGGSRVTFASGTAVVNGTKSVIKELCKRAAIIWDVDPEGVIWEDGHAKPAGSNVGDFKPLSLKELAAKAAATGGPIVAQNSVNAGGQAPGFSTQFCDVEVDPETGRVQILRYVAAQDVGKAIHPSYVEGQIQGGVVQGIGWALNEEYIYNAKGQLDNAGFLDYRCPVASDLPMIETILVEVPNPAHPYGAKGVGEVNICPPMAAIANAIQPATGVRMYELPMSPPKILAALDAQKKALTASGRCDEHRPRLVVVDATADIVMAGEGRPSTACIRGSSGKPRCWNTSRMSDAPARVVFTSGFSARYTGGKREFEVQAKNLRGVIKAMDTLFPGLGETLEEETTVAIDGELFEIDFLAPVKPGAEVFFIPKIEGG